MSSDSEDDDEKQPTGQYDDDDSEDEAKKSRKETKSSKYIDDAAEESDGEGGNVGRGGGDDDDDDGDGDDDDDEDDDLKGKGVKRGRGFIADDDDDDGGVKKEKVRITREERKLDDEDYNLINENLGLQLAREESSDEDEDGQPRRKRLRQGARSDSEEEDEGKKVSRKTGLAGALFDDDDDAGEAPAVAEVPSGRRTGYRDGMDSDDSMADFIEDDDEGPPGGEGGLGRGPNGAVASAREGGRRRSQGAAENNRIARADDMFGEDEFDDGYAEEEEEDEAPAKLGINDMYEPAVIQEYFLSERDEEIRRTDLPERLQIDMADRSLVKTLDDVRAEARWMVLKSKEIKWHYKNIIEDSGQDMVDMLNVDAGEGEPEYISLTRTKRAEVYRNNLIDKVTNVLCFVRGIANADIQHGGTFLVSSDDRRAGVPNWWQSEDPDDPKNADVEPAECPFENEIGDMRAMFDIPFIQHYRKEYYQPDLRPRDLWSIYDLDKKYCEFLARQNQLIELFRNKDDEDGKKLCREFGTEEGLNDVKAFIDLKYPASAAAAEEEARKGRKMPVKISRHKVCADAGLGKFVSKFCLTPKQLENNIRSGNKEAPADPAEEPAEFACDFVIDAEKFGFREAAAVLNGARQMAARELAAEPFLRRYVRELFFEKHAKLTVSITKKGESSSDEYFREFQNYYQQPLKEIPDEDFLFIMKAVKEGLLRASVTITEDYQEQVFRDIFRQYKSDHHNPCADAWNQEREKILMEALSQLYKLLEQNIVDRRINEARKHVGTKMTDKLETMLRVPPYQWRVDKDSKLNQPSRIMACCYSEPTEFVVIDKYGEVVQFKSIQLRVGRNMSGMSNFHENEARQLRLFFQEMQPDVVVLGGDGLKCKVLHSQLKNLVDQFQTEGVLTRNIDVLLADQKVAYRYAHSSRGLAEFPRYTPTRLMAVSLARRLQDPLRELAGLCAGLGEDVLSLQLHPLQDTMHKADKMKYMHRAFINVVNEVGVDVNLAADRMLIHGNTLQFVSGLGPRKAREILRIIAKNLYLEHRAALLEDSEIREVMREVVWYNCASFFKITKETRAWTRNYHVGQKWNPEDDEAEWVWFAGGPLEGTRIHPESYKYARQMASDALEEEDDFDCLQRALKGSLDVRTMLRNSLNDTLDIEAYGKLLQQSHGVLKTATLQDIRSELITPFEDARHLPSGDRLPWELTDMETLNLLIGETTRRTPQGDVSTLIDQVVHVKVKRVIRPATDTMGSRPGQSDSTLPYKVLCTLENGLTGVLMDRDFADDEEGRLKFQQTIREDMTISCVIVAVKYEEFAVDLTHKTSKLRQREMSMGIFTTEKKKDVNKIKYVRRNIHHPYFKNVSRNGAMAALKDEEVGEIIIRPSSQGMDLLTITRKVWANPERFQESVIKMFEQPNKTSIGRTLSVDDKVFEDLDELIIGYVEVLVKMEKKITEHDKFYAGDAKDIRSRLIEQKQSAGGKGTPYCLGFNPAPVSSGFILFWLPGTKTVQEEKVRVTTGGFVFRQQTFQSPSRLLNYFKGHAMEIFEQSRAQQPTQSQAPPPAYDDNPPPPAYQPPPNQGYAGPPPAVHWGAGSSQGPTRGGPPPPGAPPIAGAGGWNGPPGGGWGGAGGPPPGGPPEYQPPPMGYRPGFGGGSAPPGGHPQGMVPPPGMGGPPTNQPPMRY